MGLSSLPGCPNGSLGPPGLYHGLSGASRVVQMGLWSLQDFSLVESWLDDGVSHRALSPKAKPLTIAKSKARARDGRTAGASLAHSRSRRPSANSRRHVATPQRRVQVSRKVVGPGLRVQRTLNPKRSRLGWSASGGGICPRTRARV